MHRLRQYIDINSDYITDEELNIVEEKINFNEYLNEYEYSGNFIFTTNLIDRETAVKNMCCGIITHDIHLNNKTIYFAFDYGH